MARKLSKRDKQLFNTFLLEIALLEVDPVR